jgi:hypothetical protein
MLQEASAEITTKLIEMAKAGDALCLRVCMDRILPVRKDSPVTFDLPELKSVSDINAAMTAVLQAVSRGQITPAECKTLCDALHQKAETMRTTELESRLVALERRQTFAVAR